MTPLEEYAELLGEVEETFKRLSGLADQALACTKGCARCCVPFTVLPIEACRLLSAASWDDDEPASSESCPLLTRDGLCRCYKVRPLICRARGLPVRFIDAEGRSWKESCAANAFPMGLGDGCAVDLQLWNAKLYGINLRFCRQSGIPQQRISLLALRPSSELPPALYALSALG
jgi:hypothetical protein